MIDNAEDLDIVMQIYNLLEYSQVYSMASGSSWNYCRDENEDVNGRASDSRSFNYKTKIVGKTPQRSTRPGNEEMQIDYHNHQLQL